MLKVILNELSRFRQARYSGSSIHVLVQWSASLIETFIRSLQLCNVLQVIIFYLMYYTYVW